jgi:hypothetical protein
MDLKADILWVKKDRKEDSGIIFRIDTEHMKKKNEKKVRIKM